MTGSATDSYGEGIATWAWDDGGAGGTFSDPTAQNPTYTAPANTSDNDLTVTLTLTATDNDPTTPITNSGSCTLTVNPVADTFTVTPGTPSPSTVTSGGTTSLSATASDSRSGHTVTSWSWDDGGAGGRFSDATAQNPTYTAPANLGDDNLVITLTVSATSSGGLEDTKSTTLNVQPVGHTVTVGASANPTTVGSHGTTTLSATATDSRDHGIATWAWDDGGAGGTFSDATAQNPTYTAPFNHSGSDVTVTLTVTATCDDSKNPISGSNSATLTVTSTALPVADFTGTPTTGTIAPGCYLHRRLHQHAHRLVLGLRRRHDFYRAESDPQLYQGRQLHGHAYRLQRRRSGHRDQAELHQGRHLLGREHRQLGLAANRGLRGGRHRGR